MLFSKRAMTITLTTKICDIGACFDLFLSVFTSFYMFYQISKSGFIRFGNLTGCLRWMTCFISVPRRAAVTCEELRD